MQPGLLRFSRGGTSQGLVSLRELGAVVTFGQCAQAVSTQEPSTS
jgi:hypothetical protein